MRGAGILQEIASFGIENATVPAELSNVSAVAAGSIHIYDKLSSVDYYNGFSLALRRDGTVVAWDGLDSPDITDVIAIAAGGVHALALKRDGTVFAWDGRTNSASYKTVPKGLTNVIAINAGDGQSFAIVARPPTIQKQPLSQQIEVGQTAIFSAEVKGTAPFTYQWFLNGEPLVAETNLTLTITKAHASSAGSYSLQVKGRGGQATSAPAILSMPNTLTARRATWELN